MLGKLEATHAILLTSTNTCVDLEIDMFHMGALLTHQFALDTLLADMLMHFGVGLIP